MVWINSSMIKVKKERGGKVFFSRRLDLEHWQLLCTVDESQSSVTCVCTMHVISLDYLLALVCFQNLLCLVIFQVTD